MDRKFAAPYNNLGTVYFHENDNKRAKKLYKKSIKLDAATAPFWSNLGAVYMAERKYSDGAEAYEKAFLLDPDIFQDIALNGIQQFESPQELAKIYLTFAEIYAHAGHEGGGDALPAQGAAGRASTIGRSSSRTSSSQPCVELRSLTRWWASLNNNAQGRKEYAPCAR